MGYIKAVAHILYQINMLWLRITRPVTVGVRVIIQRDDSIVLVRHSYHSGWLLPGGGVKRGETLEQAARREILEETGLVIGSLDLVGAYTNFKEFKSDHIVVFHTTLIDQSILGARNQEIDAVELFQISHLPPDLLPGHLRRINDLTGGCSPARSGIW